MSRFKVGLTGGIASGKTTVSNLFAELGVSIIDADIIARQVVEPGSGALGKIEQRFGDKVLSTNGHLDRAKLREIIFSQPEQKAWLNQLLHPLIRQQMIKQSDEANSPYCILAIPLLVENQLQALVDRILVVDVPESVQIERVQQRDKVDAQHARQIQASQASREQRLAIADDVLSNTDNVATLREQVRTLHERYLALSL
ncbi:Dephospho-CoA kinase [Saliniradius amylolyticus]|uniref:Dephospho-CoA kinase n=1 Tax=Saliniradius amylolyticus TaxID=2183582 RepID=A0A2S2E6M5_9ALTE|nr:dephospho-CoA kinase [Saliniradius amylolyticus]AWL12910.1 Dephospho-CoA kinase [Saliniradius amylolyticus]